ncbi:hypothetical protein SAMN04489712_104441 [Thermomonospora echinospora]|uniref:Uncharacterized protein n=1 Tax=Thermomonospora echinospora TaxID=1992 RepID=A0A1H5Z9Z9_9ACTN|nr:hypothetical protein [Thermomonospora echinospora]SEG33122.1 hypothetical protein SAMN04489712_104441 [Thermomonospora echinospora]
MGYPGEQGRSGGHSPEPPSTPYGPGAEPHGPEQAGAGRPGQDDSPFTPPFGAFAARPGESFDTGNDRPPADDRFGPAEGGYDAGTTAQFGLGETGRFDFSTGGSGIGGSSTGGYDTGGGFDAAPGGRFASGTGGYDIPGARADGPGSGTPGTDGPGPSDFGPGGTGMGGFDRHSPGVGGYDSGGPGSAAPGTGGYDSGGFDQGGQFGAGSFERQDSPSFGPPGEYGPGQGRPGPGSFDAPDDEPYGPMGGRRLPEDGGPRGPEGFNGPEGPGEPGEGRAERRGRLPLIIGGAVVAGLVLIGSGFTVSTMLKGDSDDGAAAASTQTAAPRPTATPTPTTPPAPLNAKLKSRATDPDPLTLKEVFGTASFTQKGKKFVRTAWKHDRGCTGAVNGSKLEAALKKGGCAQVLRATYARADGLLIGTVGVLNLKTESAAKAAEKAGAGRDAFLQPLAGTGYTKKIGKGAALGTTFVRGHYLIMTWVQRPDGKTISGKYHKVVSAFQQQIILGSNLNKALHYRGIEGKPLTG